MDVHYVRVQGNDAIKINQNSGGYVVRENTFFRDIVFLIIASIICCPVCPCMAWLSMRENQVAIEAYWRGNYHDAAVKQSCAIKWCIAQALVGIVFFIIVLALGGLNSLDSMHIKL